MTPQLRPASVRAFRSILAGRLPGLLLVAAGLAVAGHAVAPRFLNPDSNRVPPIVVPPDNPMSEAKVRLGRFLFYDRRLSLNGTIACADCHRQQFAFADPKPRSVGATGQSTTRNAMTLTNVAYNARYTWASDTIRTLEQQAIVPLTQQQPLEMGASSDGANVLAGIKNDSRYVRMFSAAFPQESGPITLMNVVRAIASFERTLISLNAPYDRFVAGDAAAMSDAAQRGLRLFRSERMKCSRCHDGFNFRMTNQGRGSVEQIALHDTGLSNPGRPFKAPTLRNVAVSGPYMHDGSVATLSDVIDIYAAGGRLITNGTSIDDGRQSPSKSPLITGFAITSAEKRDLLAFLDSLTDRAFLGNSAFGNPFAREH